MVLLSVIISPILSRLEMFVDGSLTTYEEQHIQRVFLAQIHHAVSERSHTLNSWHQSLQGTNSTKEMRQTNTTRWSAVVWAGLQNVEAACRTYPSGFWCLENALCRRVMSDIFEFLPTGELVHV